MCVLWELNPQTFALLTQYSTTELRELYILYVTQDYKTSHKGQFIEIEMDTLSEIAE